MTTLQLTDDQFNRFHQDGYLIVRRLFDAEEVELLSNIARADQSLAEEAWGAKDQDGGVSRITLRGVLSKDDVYSTIVRCPRVAGGVSQLLGCEVYHWHHKVMQKEPRVGGAWEWHQDYGYWYRDGCLFPDMVSCMIAMDRATKENGCLQVLRGSHKMGRIEHGTTGGQTGADLERIEHIGKCLELVYVELEPGDTLYFHCNTLHRSDQNRSENPRWSFICCYNAAHNEPFTDHPCKYSKLDIVSDDQVKAIGQKQWAALQAQSA